MGIWEYVGVMFDVCLEIWIFLCGLYCCHFTLLLVHCIRALVHYEALVHCIIRPWFLYDTNCHPMYLYIREPCPGLFPSCFIITNILYNYNTAMREAYMEQINLPDTAIVDIASLNKTRPVHIAATYNSLNVLEFLIANGADINAQDTAGENSLHKVRLRVF